MNGVHTGMACHISMRRGEIGKMFEYRRQKARAFQGKRGLLACRFELAREGGFEFVGGELVGHLRFVNNGSHAEKLMGDA